MSQLTEIRKAMDWLVPRLIRQLAEAHLRGDEEEAARITRVLRAVIENVEKRGGVKETER